MSTLAIEINDAGITCAGGSADGRPPSPGYALVDKSTLVTGDEAFQRARLKPRQVNNRYWCELDTTPLKRPFPADLSHADLAHAHLAGIWSQLSSGVDGVVLAVPGSFGDTELGLVLGVAQACKMPVSGMVDSAVAAASTGCAGTHLIHVDLQLHRAVLTELVQEDLLVRRHVEVSNQLGLAALHDRWVKQIAELFVRETRFDPLHDAEWEQKLYQRLPAWLTDLGREPSVTLTLERPGQAVSVELTRAMLVAPVERDYEHLARLVKALVEPGQRTTLVFSDRAATLPGFSERLSSVGDFERAVLPPGAAARGALRQHEWIKSPAGEVRFVVQLPRATADSRPTGPTPIAPPRSPTHLLYEGTAYPIGAELAVGRALPEGVRGIRVNAAAAVEPLHCTVRRDGPRVLVDNQNGTGTYVNGERVVDRRPLTVGDRLTLEGGAELLPIVVEQSRG